jgi:autotransporter-associated beta strand protein
MKLNNVVGRIYILLLLALPASHVFGGGTAYTTANSGLNQSWSDPNTWGSTTNYPGDGTSSGPDSATLSAVSVPSSLNLNGNSYILNTLQINSGGSAPWQINNGTLTLEGVGYFPYVYFQPSLTDNSSLPGTVISTDIDFVDPGSITVSSQTTISGTISGAGTESTGTGIVTEGPGTLILSGNNTYTGGTTVDTGTLAVDGSIVGDVTVNSGAELGGHGSIGGTIGGAGSVGPGDSPGILTASATDPTGGLTYNFEMTQAGSPTWATASASGNDVLHLESGTPFTAPLTSANIIDVYFAADSLTYDGGFFTDGSIDELTANIDHATFDYFLLDNTNGTISYNGNLYDAYLGSVDSSIVPVTGADFGDGVVDGFTEEFIVAPEPSTWALLLLGGCGLWFLKRRRSTTKSSQA